MKSDSLIFDIKRYAINDGPGIRIVIFFKGCNLNCAWCHNPESISPLPEKMYSVSKCIRCGSCIGACPNSALSMSTEGIVTNVTLCNQCGRCAEECPTLAIEMSGKKMTVEEIIGAIEKERVFFEQSGGGVTFSGGEPLLHMNILSELLDECGRRRIHRAIDTAGAVSPDILMKAAGKTDLFLWDYKIDNNEDHSRWTGSGNRLIKENLITLSASGAEIIVRIPFIGGVNDDVPNIKNTAEFISRLPRIPREINLLPWHKIAVNKYSRLGRPGDFVAFSEPDPESIALAVEIFASAGLKASVGG